MFLNSVALCWPSWWCENSLKHPSCNCVLIFYFIAEYDGSISATTEPAYGKLVFFCFVFTMLRFTHFHPLSSLV